MTTEMMSEYEAVLNIIDRELGDWECTDRHGNATTVTEMIADELKRYREAVGSGSLPLHSASPTTP